MAWKMPANNNVIVVVAIVAVVVAKETTAGHKTWVRANSPDPNI